MDTEHLLNHVCSLAVEQTRAVECHLDEHEVFGIAPVDLLFQISRSLN